MDSPRLQRQFVTDVLPGSCSMHGCQRRNRGVYGGETRTPTPKLT
jgi:hypothetical protein